MDGRAEERTIERMCMIRIVFALLVVSHDSIRGCVRPSVRRSVRWSVGNAFVSFGREEPANDLFRVYKLVRLQGRISSFVF